MRVITVYVYRVTVRNRVGSLGFLIISDRVLNSTLQGTLMYASTTCALCLLSFDVTSFQKKARSHFLHLLLL